MLPTREQAEELLREAEQCNPGPWGNHSRVAAQICLTHSFNNQSTTEYIGKFDTTPEELKLIQDALEATDMDDYDRLIQLCDSLAGAEGVMDIEERMGDVKRRYGDYPREKWNCNLALKKYFEDKMGKDVYVVVDKDGFRP